MRVAGNPYFGTGTGFNSSLVERIHGEPEGTRCTTTREAMRVWSKLHTVVVRAVHDLYHGRALPDTRGLSTWHSTLELGCLHDPAQLCSAACAALHTWARCGVRGLGTGVVRLRRWRVGGLYRACTAFPGLPVSNMPCRARPGAVPGGTALPCRFRPDLYTAEPMEVGPNATYSPYYWAAKCVRCRSSQLLAHTCVPSARSNIVAPFWLTNIWGRYSLFTGAHTPGTLGLLAATTTTCCVSRHSRLD